MHTDKFSVSADGHYIGDDGFVVPKTFDEFYERYPDYLRKIAANYLHLHLAEPEVADLVQEMIVELLAKKAIEKFDPIKCYGCNIKRWFNYLNYCARNTAHTGYVTDKKRPLKLGVQIVDNARDIAEGEGGISMDYLLDPNPFNVDDKIHIEQLKKFMKSHTKFYKDKLSRDKTGRGKTTTVSKKEALNLLYALIEHGGNWEAARIDLGYTHRQLQSGRNLIRKISRIMVEK